MDCVFCNFFRDYTDRIVIDRPLAFLIRKESGVLHSLVVPKRHVSSFFELSKQELLEVNLLLRDGYEHIRLLDPLVEGFSIEITSKRSGLHSYIELIPRTSVSEKF